MNRCALIFCILLAGCARSPELPITLHSSPLALNAPLGGAATKLVFAGGNEQPEVVTPPIVLDPPAGVTIPLPALADKPSDYFTSTNPAGPWMYRTDDLAIVTNTDGTTWGSFSNSPRGMTQEFYMVVPVDEPDRLPANIITNH